ncbi:hypothetical protein VPHD325_0098 [Vibrio phage D325]
MKGCESSSLSSTAKFLMTLLPQLCRDSAGMTS